MKKINFLIAAITILLLQSCLKGRDMVLDPTQVPGVVEFGNLASLGSAPADSFRVYSVNYEIAPSATLEVPVNYTGPNSAPKDITVNVGVDNSLLTQYNTVKGTTINLLPPNTYTLPTSAVIKAGSRTAIIPVIIKVDQIDVSKPFALPLNITGASGETISKNFGRIMVRITPKNIYDGVYKITSGIVQRYSSPTSPTVGDALNGSLVGNPNITLTTVGPTSVEIGNLRWAGGTSGIAGIDNLQVTVNPSTNLVTVKSIGNATLANIAGAVNKYDPATKTFTLNFDWNQTAAKREIKNLIFTYQGPR